MDEENLQLLLGTQFEGIEQARQYAAAMERVARAETKAAESVTKAMQAQKELNATRGEMPASLPLALGPTALKDLPVPKDEPKEPRQAPLPMGPHQRLLKAGEDFDRAKSEGTTAQIADAHYALRHAQNRMEQAQRGAMSPQAQALYSTRLNLPGGAAPLLGKTLESFLGKEKAISVLESFSSKLMPLVGKAGPIGLLAAATYAAAKGAFDLADASSKATNSYSQSQAMLGGSMQETARVRMMGSPEAARSFAERISTDPMAMSAAGQVGVHQLKTPYGDMNFAKGYLKAIENTAKITDTAQRRRLAILQGIEQEVAQWSLMSLESQKRIKETAAMSAKVNDPAAQKLAADFKASQDAMSAAKENLANAAGHLFSEPAAGFLNDLASLMNWAAGIVKDGKKWIELAMLPLATAFPMALPFVRGAAAGFAKDQGGQGQAPQGSLMEDNTKALLDNTIAMQKLTQNVGGGSRAREVGERFRFLGSASNFSRDAQTDFRIGALG